LTFFSHDTRSRLAIQGGMEGKYITKEIKDHINTNIIGILCQNVATGFRDTYAEG